MERQKKSLHIPADDLSDSYRTVPVRSIFQNFIVCTHVIMQILTYILCVYHEKIDESRIPTPDIWKVIDSHFLLYQDRYHTTVDFGQFYSILRINTSILFYIPRYTATWISTCMVCVHPSRINRTYVLFVHITEMMKK